MMEPNDRVDIKQYIIPDWVWTDNKGRVRRGHITDMDKHCLTVCADDGEIVRDVREHFRKAT